MVLTVLTGGTHQEALSLQSAEVDMVRGATYTGDGYLNCLQSASDQAEL